MPAKSRGWEIEEASGESIGRPFNGRPVAFSLFRDGSAFGEAGVFCGHRVPMLLEQKAGKTQRSELFENRENCEAVSAAARQVVPEDDRAFPLAISKRV